MREHVSQKKKTTTGFSIPSPKHPTPGFGSESSAISRPAVPDIQPLHKPVPHDFSRIPVRSPQAKLSISQPGDKYEQEADSVAQQVMQRMAQPVNRQSIQRVALPELEELQMKSLDNSTLQRQEAPEDESELQMKPMVQRQAGMDAAPDLEAFINQARGGGQAMAENIRHPMEQAFGADFSRVKVHTDRQSDQLNQSIQARAFTTGHDVFFRQGEYNPGSRGGQELLAHELTHVVQQGRVVGSGDNISKRKWNNPSLPKQQPHQAKMAKMAEGQTEADKENTPPRLEIGKTGNQKTVQRKLNPHSEKIFRTNMQKLLPKVPVETVNEIVERYEGKQHGTALAEAKDLAYKIEQLAIEKKDGNASINQASRSMVNELLQAYEPKTHHYVLLGGSPAVLDKALRDKTVSFSHLPLGGLTDATKQKESLGRELYGEKLRNSMLNYLESTPALKEYLETFLQTIDKENLVLIDYTHSGGSILVTADLLKNMSKKTVKLFTFSGNQLGEGSDLLTQKDYELVSLFPLGQDERTFVTLTDTKAYKEKIGLVAYKSLSLSILSTLTNKDYKSVLQAIKNEEGQEQLSIL